MMNIASAAARYSPTLSAATAAIHIARSAEMRFSSSSPMAREKVLYPATSVRMMAVSIPAMFENRPVTLSSNSTPTADVKPT